MTLTGSRRAVRQMIREAVRSHCGLLSEGVGTSEGFTVDLADDGTFTITAPDGESLTQIVSLVITKGDAFIVRWSAESAERVFTSWTGISWKKVEEAGPGKYVFTMGLGEFDSDTKTLKTEQQVRYVSVAVEWEAPEEAASGGEASAGEEPASADAGSAAATAAAAPAAVEPAAVGTDIAPVQRAASKLSIQDKIRQGASAVEMEFADRTEPGQTFDIQRLAADSPAPSGHAWISNDADDRSAFGLSDFSRGEGYSDEYTYFALVNTESGKPVAFVVASDPESNKHFSTGRFIGPTSNRRNLRLAFCYLYHRATGEVHESCEDGATTGPDDDILRGSGRRRGGTADSSASRTGTGEGPGAVRLVAKDGVAARGRGDAMTGVLGIGLRPAEKLRGAGYKIITKAKDKQGFTSFPVGPDDVFRRDPIGTAGGKLPPSSLGVRFANPMAIITDASGKNPYVNFGENKTKGDIKTIAMGWGGRGIRAVRIKPGDKGFDEAAEWILANQAEFDLRPDGPNTVEVTDEVKSTGRVAPAENRGLTVAEGSRRSLTPLWDRYRF